MILLYFARERVSGCATHREPITGKRSFEGGATSLHRTAAAAAAAATGLLQKLPAAAVVALCCCCCCAVLLLLLLLCCAAAAVCCCCCCCCWVFEQIYDKLISSTTMIFRGMRASFRVCNTQPITDKEIIRRRGNITAQQQ